MRAAGKTCSVCQGLLVQTTSHLRSIGTTAALFGHAQSVRSRHPALLRRRSRQLTCRVSVEAPPDTEFDPLAKYEGALRAAPLAAGAVGICCTLLNRLLSGVAPIATASSSQSRADVLLIAMSSVLVLTGLQWLALAPKDAVIVEPSGVRVEWAAADLLPAASDELRWAWQALAEATRCCGLVAFWDGKCVFHAGAAAGNLQPGGAEVGSLVNNAQTKQQGNYLANLKLYPGRFEFFQYLPSDVQGVALAPMGSRGCLVAAVDAVRGFSRLDQQWLATLADKLDSTLDDGEDAAAAGSEPQQAAAVGAEQ